MKCGSRLFWVLGMVLAVACPAGGGELVERRFAARDYTGSRARDYLVYLPDGAGAPPLPLVVVLHGCRQTHRDIMAATGFNAVADAEGFIVVYPFVTSFEGVRDRHCWGFWLDDEIQQGRGEAADIAGIVAEVEAAHPVDPNRIHITGLSSGGAMATAVMVAYSERIASGAPAAGLAYAETACGVRGVCFNFSGVSLLHPSTWFRLWEPVFQEPSASAAAMAAEMGAERRLVPILLLHAEGDGKVDIQAARNNAAAWATLFHVDLAAPTSVSRGTDEGRAWTRHRYGAGAVSAIETHFVEADVHAWIGGGEGPYADPDGPDWARIAWAFFEAHPFDARP